MKIIFTLISLCLFSSLYAQEKWTYQNDSIYKVNKVKSRKSFNGDKLTATIFYDTEGRITKIQRAPYIDGKQITVHFEYSDEGKLINKIDTIFYGKPNELALKKLKKSGIKLSSINKGSKSKIEVSKYDLLYSNNNLIKLTKYNPDGSLNFVDFFENNGLKKTRKWYKEGEFYQQSTTIHINEFYKKKYYGWEIIKRSEIFEWNYSFDYEYENGLVKQFTRYDNGDKKETFKFIYNENGLISEILHHSKVIFEYEYYKK